MIYMAIMMQLEMIEGNHDLNKTVTYTLYPIYHRIRGRNRLILGVCILEQF